MIYPKRLTRKWLMLLFLLTSIVPLFSEDSQISTPPHHGQETISLDDCILIAHDEIATLAQEAKQALALAVQEAVATEQRNFLPVVAGLEAEVEAWKIEAVPSFWDQYGLAIAGGSLIAGRVAALILAAVIPK